MSVNIFNSEDQSLVKLASNNITAEETIETLNDIKVSVATDKASVAADKATVSADKADIVSMKSEIANTKTTIDETAQTISENANSVQQEKIAIDKTKTDIDKKYTEISNTASKLNTKYNNLTSNYYTKEATNSLISSTTKPKYSVVNELPTSDISTDIIYLKSTNTTSTDGVYEMYTYQDSNWVKIGNSNPDLADYYTKELADSTFATKTEINNTNTEISELKEDLAHIISKTDGSFTSDDLSVFTTIEDGKYTKGGTPTSLANYKMMYFKATKDFHFWCDENCTDSTQFYICVFRNDTISTANNVNKYLIGDTSTPLPTVDNKGFCESGNLFVVSILTPNTSPKYFRIETDYIDGEVKLKDSLGLPATGRQEVADMIEEEVASTIRKNYLQYSAITTSTSTEEVNIYIPTYKGYIQYKFIHTVVDAKHTDVWRIDRAYSCEEDLTQIKQLTTEGEWEFAFGLYGRPSGSSHFGSGFIGGKQHGNEMLNSILFVVDGKVVNIAELTSLTEWNTLEIYENTTMYDSNDDTTPCCEHGSSHIFSDKGVIVKQFAKWLIQSRMRTSYMAMFPVAKTVTDTLMVDNTWKQESARPTSGTSIRYDKSKYAILSKDSERFIGKFYVTDYPSGLDADGDYFLCTDNTTDYSGVYNKCYFTVTGNSGNHTVSVGDLWKSETHYELSVNN